MTFVDVIAGVLADSRTGTTVTNALLVGVLYYVRGLSRRMDRVERVVGREHDRYFPPLRPNGEGTQPQEDD